MGRNLRGVILRAALYNAPGQCYVARRAAKICFFCELNLVAPAGILLINSKKVAKTRGAAASRQRSSRNVIPALRESQFVISFVRSVALPTKYSCLLISIGALGNNSPQQ